MNCEKARELCSALIDNEADARERVHLEAHLASCGKCRQALSEMIRLNRLLQQLPVAAASSAFAISSSSVRPPRRIAPTLALAAALLLAVGLVFWARPNPDANINEAAADIATIPHIELLTDAEFLGLETLLVPGIVNVELPVVSMSKGKGELS